ncbi:MAG: TIGR03619 family F420-dependent LLM class oxidoreductase [Aigarchaeota archaeon]|nr:TIGR03619 family F420-dependent LLM class oxidoreductase [Candidatus Calditenuis fumarioli]
MRFGICVPNFGNNLSREGVVRSAMEAERLGYDSVWTTDHITVGAAHPYPYGRILESLTTLSYIAAKTESITLGTSIVVMPLRPTILTAKQLATIDYLSGGRLIVGVGAGWEPTEFRTFGVDFRRRGALLEEQLRLLRVLWSSERPVFEGRFHRVRDVIFSPLPAQKGGPRIWVGGNTERAVRRALSLADGWHFTGIPFDELEERMALIRSSGREGFTVSGRLTVKLDPSAKSEESRSGSGERRYIVGGWASRVAEELSRYAKLGVEHVAIYLGDLPVDALLSKMREFVKDVVPSVG